MHKLFIRNEAKKSIRKIKKSCSNEFFIEFGEILKNLQRDPFIGNPYKGNMEGFFKCVYGKSPEYRIIFLIVDLESEQFKEYDLSGSEINEIKGVVDVVWVKTREECNNLYRQKSKYFKNKK